MTAYSSTRRSTSPLLVIVLTLMLIVVGGGGTVAALAALGMIDLPFMRPPAPSHEGQLLVPMSGRTIPAYALIHRDDLANPQTGLWNEQWIPAGALPSDAITNRSKIIGRVMNHEKGSGYVFTEGDFMPVGTRYGVVAGIPPGKRSFTVEASKISGIHGLQLGDRFDLVGTLAVEKNRPTQRNVRGADSLTPPEPEVRVLVSNGMIVSPLRMRAAISSSQSLMSGSRTTSKPVEEVVIALDPEEIPGLTAAMSRNATIALVARSGHPDDAKIDSFTPNSSPPPPPTVIETVVGDKRETVVFPQLTSEEEPAAAPQRPAFPPFPLHPRGKPKPLPVRNSVDAAEETAYAPLKPGTRMNP